MPGANFLIQFSGRCRQSVLWSGKEGPQKRRARMERLKVKKGKEEREKERTIDEARSLERWMG